MELNNSPNPLPRGTGQTSTLTTDLPAGTGPGEKRRRGRPPKRLGAAPKQAPPAKKAKAVRVMKEEADVWEDVCFICFDGGSLVLCDRKGCPKAYHASCIKRDDAYFQSKGKWNCGWHICSVCQRASQFMCYTCTYSLCKSCIKQTDFVCVRGNMGLCTTCMKTIMLIENKDQANKELVQVDFDDKLSWEYLFKVYWIYLRQSISLSLHELTQAKNLSQEVGSVACSQKLHDLRSGVNYENEQILNGLCEQFNLENRKDLEQSPNSGKVSASGASLIRCKEWATKELLEFVAHVKNGDTSVLSQSDVQGLLLEYIKKNGLMEGDCQVTCDLRLTNLFGKPRVSQNEMLKLLEQHLLMNKEIRNSSGPARIVGTTSSHSEHMENKESLARGQNSCKKFEVGVPQNNLDEYAAIDVHNMNLIYLPRNLMESLIQDENFNEKVVGSIVRIKISNSDQKQDMFRLVQVRGTNKAPAPYKLGNKTVDAMLEVLNLDKKESIAIDTISDQEFSPDECRHLREIIKCGLVKPLTVGEVRKKAMELLAVRLDERLDAEILKLSQLCDQTSEKEQIKELRLRITKLQLLKTPEECQRRFSGIIQVHADPKMSPDYDSEQDAEGGDRQKPEAYIRSESSELSKSDCRHNNSQREAKDEGLVDGQHKVDQKSYGTGLSDQAVSKLGAEHSAATIETESSSPMNESETEKLWYYRDPSDKIQGPFSIVQLREWSMTGYFPPDMRIWTVYEHEDSILLTEALNGQFHTAAHLLYNLSLQSHQLRGSNRISDSGSNDNTDKLSRDDNLIVGTMKTGPGGVQCRESSESGGCDVFDSNTGGQSSKNNESGTTDTLGGTSGMQSKKNSECGKTNVMVDTGIHSRENSEPGRTDVSLPGSCGFTEPGFSPKDMQQGHSVIQELKRHNSSSDHCQTRQQPSSTNGSRHVSTHQALGHGREGSRSTPKHGKKVSDGSAANLVAGQSHENKSNVKSKVSQQSGQARRSTPKHEKQGADGFGTTLVAGQSHENKSNDKSNETHQSGQAQRSTPKHGKQESDGFAAILVAAQSHENKSNDKRNETQQSGQARRSTPKHGKQESEGFAAILVAGQSHENKSNGKSNESHSLGQARRSFPINLNSNDIDLNSGLSPATNSDSSKQSCDMELPTLPVQTQREGTREPETEAAQNSQLSLDVPRSGMPDLTSPMLKLSNESQVPQVTKYKPPPSLKVEYQDLRPKVTEYKPSPSLKVEYQDLLTSRGSGSSLVVGGAQFQNIANDWGGYPPAPVKPVLEGWSSGLVSSSSLKQHEITGDHATATANVDPLGHISACNPTPNSSGWHGIVEPIEFISLAEESVSDLLAEVDAMESQSGGFPSPTSAMRCEDEMMRFCKNECFTIEDLTPTNPGRSDALSSTGDTQLPCQSTAMQEPVCASESNTYESLKKSSRHSSNSRDRNGRSADGRFNQRDASHPGLSLTMSQDINSAVPQTSRVEVTDSGIMGRAPEHINLFWGSVPAQGINNIGWATNQGTSYGNPNMNRGAHNANGGLQWDGQRKYTGERHHVPRDYSSHGGDVGYGKVRPSWNRQPFGGGGGYARSPRGQRVCKFYENGNCRKGASCDYLHP